MNRRMIGLAALLSLVLANRADALITSPRHLRDFLTDSSFIFTAKVESVDPDKLRPHQHPGSEFLLVVKGKLGLRIGVNTYELESGDSIYFDPSVPHTYRRVGRAPCQAMIVTAA